MLRQDNESSNQIYLHTFYLCYLCLKVALCVRLCLQSFLFMLYINSLDVNVGIMISEFADTAKITEMFAKARCKSIGRFGRVLKDIVES